MRTENSLKQRKASKFFAALSSPVFLGFLLTLIPLSSAAVDITCISNLALADHDLDSSLSIQEYWAFVISISPGFARQTKQHAPDLPLSGKTQETFYIAACDCEKGEGALCCPESEAAPGIDVYGVHLGQDILPEERERLDTFCRRTRRAISQDLRLLEEGTHPERLLAHHENSGFISESSSLFLPESLGKQASPRSVDINTCRASLAINDLSNNNNLILEPDEYASFVRQISRNEINYPSFNQLPNPLQDKFNELSENDSGIDIAGARPPTTSEQEAFLERVCTEVGIEIDLLVVPEPSSTPPPTPSNGGQQVVPTNPPASTTPPPTPGQGIPIRTRPPFGGRPTLPPLSMPTSPPQAPTLPPLSTPPPTLRPTFAVPTTSQPTTATQTTPPPTPPTTPPSTQPPTPPPTPPSSPPPTPPPTQPPTRAPTPNPTIASTTRPPTKQPTEAPTQTPSELLEGILVTSKPITFRMSNSLLLDQDHLVSGPRRRSLNQAFNNLCEKIAEQEFSRRELKYLRRRRLILTFDYGTVDSIVDSECENEVPQGTLCATCEASYTVNAVNEDDSEIGTKMEAMNAKVTAAIEAGDLQNELDLIDPETPIRIEEGTNIRARDTPPGYYSVSEISYSSIAGIGVAVCVCLCIFACLFNRYCSGCCAGKDEGSSRPPSKKGRQSKKELPPASESAPKEEKKSGWFGKSVNDISDSVNKSVNEATSPKNKVKKALAVRRFT